MLLVPCNVVNRCHPYAQCVPDPYTGNYSCECIQGYEGDGIDCDRIGTHTSTYPEDEPMTRYENQYSFAMFISRRSLMPGRGHMPPERRMPPVRAHCQVRLQPRLRREWTCLRSHRCFDFLASCYLLFLYTKTLLHWSKTRSHSFALHTQTSAAITRTAKRTRGARTSTPVDATSAPATRATASWTTSASYPTARPIHPSAT